MSRLWTSYQNVQDQSSMEYWRTPLNEIYCKIHQRFRSQCPHLGYVLQNGQSSILPWFLSDDICQKTWRNEIPQGTLQRQVEEHVNRELMSNYSMWITWSQMQTLSHFKALLYIFEVHAAVIKLIIFSVCSTLWIIERFLTINFEKFPVLEICRWDKWVVTTCESDVPPLDLSFFFLLFFWTRDTNYFLASESFFLWGVWLTKFALTLELSVFFSSTSSVATLNRKTRLNSKVDFRILGLRKTRKVKQKSSSVQKKKIRKKKSKTKNRNQNRSFFQMDNQNRSFFRMGEGIQSQKSLLPVNARRKTRWQKCYNRQKSRNLHSRGNSRKLLPHF